MREEGAIHFKPQLTCWLSFQINFYLLRLIASHGYKSECEKVAKEEMANTFTDSSGLSSWAFFWEQDRGSSGLVLPDPKREHSLPLSFSCIHRLIFFLPITEPTAKQERWSRRQVFSQLLSPAKGMEGHPALAFGALHRKPPGCLMKMYHLWVSASWVLQ